MFLPMVSFYIGTTRGRPELAASRLAAQGSRKGRTAGTAPMRNSLTKIGLGAKNALTWRTAIGRASSAQYSFSGRRFDRPASLNAVRICIFSDGVVFGIAEPRRPGWLSMTPMRPGLRHIRAPNSAGGNITSRKRLSDCRSGPSSRPNRCVQLHRCFEMQTR